MELLEAITILFDETCPVVGAPSVQILHTLGWRTIPLEWNVAMRLSRISGLPVRLLDAGGDPMRTYHEKLEGAEPA